MIILTLFFAGRNGKKYAERKRFRLAGSGWETFKGEVDVKPEIIALHYGVQTLGQNKTVEIRNPEFRH